MNATSSRSHAVFTVKAQFLEGKAPEPDAKDERKALNAKINLVDLAGSERQSKTGAEGATLKEGCAINQSLSALGMVIKELSEAMGRKDGKGVVPFRASKLTFLLKDSLSGNSKTYMIAALSPASDNTEETVSTLRFASSVKKIKTVATQNKDKKDEMIEQLQEEIRKLKESGAVAGDDSGETKLAVEEREKLMADMKKSFEDQIQQSEKMEEARKEALDDGGLSHDEINQAFGVDSQTPYLLNMADDPMLAGCLLYILQEGASTTIGSAKENKIKLQGIGIPDQLCQIENKGNTNLTITKIKKKGRVVINGKLLNKGNVMNLNHNDKIFLGRAYALKLTLPAAASAEKEDDLAGLGLQGLDDEWAALDHSPSWAAVQMFLDQILGRMPRDQAKKLFEDVKEACKLCDEANDITEECREDERIRFEVDLTNSLPCSVAVRVLQTAEDPNVGPTALYLWPLHTTRERVQRMRDAHEAFCRNGSHDVDALLDPWHEAPAADIASRLMESDLLIEDLRNELSQMRNKKIYKLQKVVMGWLNDGVDHQKGICFRAWASHTQSMNKSKKPTLRKSITLSRSGTAGSRSSSALSPSGSAFSRSGSGIEGADSPKTPTVSKTTTPAQNRSSAGASTPKSPEAKASPKTTGTDSTPPKAVAQMLPAKNDAPADASEVTFYPLPDEFSVSELGDSQNSRLSSQTQAIKKKRAPALSVTEARMPMLHRGSNPVVKAEPSKPPSQLQESDQEITQALSKSQNLTKMLDEVGEICRQRSCEDAHHRQQLDTFNKQMLIDELGTLHSENDSLRKLLEHAMTTNGVLKDRLLSQTAALPSSKDDVEACRRNDWLSLCALNTIKMKMTRLHDDKFIRVAERSPSRYTHASRSVSPPRSTSSCREPRNPGVAQTPTCPLSQTSFVPLRHIPSQTDVAYLPAATPHVPLQTNSAYPPAMCQYQQIRLQAVPMDAPKTFRSQKP
eukprot:gnl/MRDRNA2_/MRDRNA2_35885_c0_seq1.p1 gnl/MRDRNA2_/MRDRNA2_35885_c0~~gnl/MRDRNA2_/MRDRNA2_35885_c0_seq1.p1  ORF type:complete len:1050 (+),score=220.73 gnl/MRDRNA2_/MRDRNA2_35885_c0_seq1:253-3150(+)